MKRTRILALERIKQGQTVIRFVVASSNRRYNVWLRYPTPIIVFSLQKHVRFPFPTFRGVSHLPPNIPEEHTHPLGPLPFSL
jgi:hypothetical protein